jgi:hypothetical protein
MTHGSAFGSPDLQTLRSRSTPEPGRPGLGYRSKLETCATTLGEQLVLDTFRKTFYQQV